MSSHICKFCNIGFVVNAETYKSHSLSFANSYEAFYDPDKSAVSVKFYKCPVCEKISVHIVGIGSQFKDKEMDFYPNHEVIILPEYIPESIREDFQEAYAILNISPKASATLSRRCLQSMLRDFWEVENERNLYSEIESIEDRVDPTVREVLHSIRQIGNIGAHSEKDTSIIVPIEPGEAEKLIMFIKFLIDEWYVKRFNTQQLMSDINEINQNMQNERSSD